MNKIIFIGIIIIIIIIILYFFLNNKKEYFQQTSLESPMNWTDFENEYNIKLDNLKLNFNNYFSKPSNELIKNIFSKIVLCFILIKIYNNKDFKITYIEELLIVFNELLYNPSLGFDNETVKTILEINRFGIQYIFEKYKDIINSEKNFEVLVEQNDESKKFNLKIKEVEKEFIPTTTSLAPINSAFKMPLIQFYKPN